MQAAASCAVKDKVQSCKGRPPVEAGLPHSKPRGERFPTSRWSLILRKGQDSFGLDRLDSLESGRKKKQKGRLNP